MKIVTKYAGSVTDHLWITSVLRCSTFERIAYVKDMSKNFKVDEAYNFIYGIGRMPRIYLDEHNSKGKKQYEN